MEDVKRITEGYMDGCLRVSEFRNQLIMLLSSMPSEDVHAIAIMLANAFEKED